MENNVYLELISSLLKPLKNGKFSPLKKTSKTPFTHGNSTNSQLSIVTHTHPPPFLPEEVTGNYNIYIYTITHYLNINVLINNVNEIGY